MRPSTNSIMRSQRAANRGSCVTTKKAVPCSRLNSRINSKMLSLVCVSRLPVGSSASTKRGERTSARDRHALLHAAGELAGFFAVSIL